MKRLEIIGAERPL